MSETYHEVWVFKSECVLSVLDCWSKSVVSDFVFATMTSGWTTIAERDKSQLDNQPSTVSGTSSGLFSARLSLLRFINDLRAPVPQKGIRCPAVPWLVGLAQHFEKMSANQTTTTPTDPSGGISTVASAIDMLIVGTFFPALLVPIAAVLFFFSTPKLRRRPLFILNVLAIVFALGLGGIIIYNVVCGCFQIGTFYVLTSAVESRDFAPAFGPRICAGPDRPIICRPDAHPVHPPHPCLRRLPSSSTFLAAYIPHLHSHCRTQDCPHRQHRYLRNSH